MMTKGDYEAVGSALANMQLGPRVVAYRRLVRSLSARDPKFDAWKFGNSMGLPPLFRNNNNEMKR